MKKKTQAELPNRGNCVLFFTQHPESFQLSPPIERYINLPELEIFLKKILGEPRWTILSSQFNMVECVQLFEPCRVPDTKSSIFSGFWSAS